MKAKSLKLLFFLFIATIAHAQERPAAVLESLLDQWHLAAARADFETYTSLMTPDAVFIGTDPTENWKGQEFREFAKPYFDLGKAWSFNKLERHIFVAENQQTAWFDELLNTQMGICRGSGIILNTENGWKIAHYVLSIAVPNDQVETLTQMKKNFDQALIQKLKNN